MKKIISILLASALLLSFSLTVSAEEFKFYSEENLKTFLSLLSENREEAFDYKYEEMDGDGGGPYEAFSEKEISLFKSEKNYIIIVDMSFDRWERVFKEIRKKEPDYVNTVFKYSFEVYSSDLKTYDYKIDLVKRNAVTTAEIMNNCGITDKSKAVYIELGYYNQPDISGYNIYKCTKGWNRINNTDYYVKSDGTLATKSTIIDGVRYKFTSDGVCHGKYTGWTKSSAGRKYWKDGKLLTKSAIINGVRYKIKSNGICEGKYTGWTTSGKGKRYWKNGLLVTEKYIRTTSGRRYYADKNGYVTVVNN